MTVLSDLVDALADGRVEVVDLSAPLSEETPILELPPEFGQTARFQLEEISRYDDRGPAWYWNNFRTGEHTGTHFDAPNHWVTGKDKADVGSVPPAAFLAPAVVLDVADRVADDPNFLIEVEHIRAFEADHGALPAGGWLLCRTGWSARVTQADMINNTETGPTALGCRRTARVGWLRSRPFRASGSRPSALTPAPRTPSTRRSRATPS